MGGLFKKEALSFNFETSPLADYEEPSVFVIQPFELTQYEKIISIFASFETPGKVYFHKGEKGRPDHYHNGMPLPDPENYARDKTADIQVCDPKQADDATSPDWKDWRDRVTQIGSFIWIALMGPVEGSIEAGAEVGRQIDPWVNELKARRSKDLERWLSPY